MRPSTKDEHRKARAKLGKRGVRPYESSRWQRSNLIDIQNRQPEIPEGYEDILESTLAHVATIEPNGEPQFDLDGEHVKFSQTRTRQKHRPGDERVVVLVWPQHTTKMGR